MTDNTIDLSGMLLTPKGNADVIRIALRWLNYTNLEAWTKEAECVRLAEMQLRISLEYLGGDNGKRD